MADSPKTPGARKRPAPRAPRQDDEPAAPKAKAATTKASGGAPQKATPAKASATKKAAPPRKNTAKEIPVEVAPKTPAPKPPARSYSPRSGAKKATPTASAPAVDPFGLAKFSEQIDWIVLPSAPGGPQQSHAGIVAGTPNLPSRQLSEGSGIPRTFKNEYSWFFSGLERRPWPVLVALLAAWTGLIVAMWAASLGLILGVLVAVGLLATNSFTRSLYSAGAGQAVTIVGVVTGALAGAGGSFTAIYSHELLGKPSNVVVSLASGVILAIIIVAVIAGAEGDLLRLRGYRRLSLTETRRISPLLQQVGNEMATPGLTPFRDGRPRPPSGMDSHATHCAVPGLA